MDYSKKINEASWLNESQKQRLLAVHETINWKNVIEEAFDMLDVLSPEVHYANAIAYKNMVVDLIAQLQHLKLNPSIAEDYAALLQKLYYFFDILDSPSFDTIIAIEKAYNHSDDSNGHEKAIDKLYRQKLNETKDKLQILETV